MSDEDLDPEILDPEPVQGGPVTNVGGVSLIQPDTGDNPGDGNYASVYCLTERTYTGWVPESLRFVPDARHPRLEGVCDSCGQKKSRFIHNAHIAALSNLPRGRNPLGAILPLGGMVRALRMRGGSYGLSRLIGSGHNGWPDF
jgi:hypothetical protein